MTFSQKLAMSHASHVGDSVFLIARAGQSFVELAGASMNVLIDIFSNITARCRLPTTDHLASEGLARFLVMSAFFI
jgi:hypothetical protein